MKKSLLGLFIFCLFSLSAIAQPGNVSGPTFPNNWSSINAAIAANPAGSTLTLSAGQFTENVVVSKSMIIIGAGDGTQSVINPSSGIGITVTANGVSLQYLKVAGITGSLQSHGIWANNVSSLSMTNVTAMGNAGSGIALQNVKATTLNNVTCQGNYNHGLEIGNGSMGVTVNSGTFNNNGTVGNLGTGGGIMIYADAGQSTNSTSIIGTVNANTNKTAGIYLSCAQTGHIVATTIGATGTINLDDNGSTSGSLTGGAAVLLWGPCNSTKITANSYNHNYINPTAGLVVLGLDGSGNFSPTNTIATNCVLTGFTTTSPAGSMKATDGTTTYICNLDVDATVGNLIDGVVTGFDVEDVLVHKVDDFTLGRFNGPFHSIFVTQNSGSINRGIAVASSNDTVQVKAGTAYGENVIINKSITLRGQGTSTIITPSSGIGITVSVADVTIQDLKVYHAPNHGIYAGSVSGLIIKNVVADLNGFGGIASGIALQGVTSTPNASILTNVTATNNTNHGLEIGRGCVGVQVVGGDFSSNGTLNHLETGGGIMLYSDLTDVSNRVQNTVIKGILTANTNKTAGIYIYSTPGLVTGTSIGQTGSITLSDNGSYNTPNLIDGGAGVLIYGGADLTTITATFSRTSVVGAGLVALGVDGSGTNSPTNTTIKNSTFSVNYNNISSPAISLARKKLSPDYISNQPIDALTGNTITGATTSSAIEDLIWHHPDDANLGLVSFTQPAGLLVKAKVFLQGAYSGGTMVTTLNSLGYLPTSSSTAYNTTTFGYTNKTVTSIPNANVVDWVLVELRTGSASSTKVETQAAFLLNDGTVVDIDGSSDLNFTSAASGDYYIVIRHRNHLAIMSASLVTLPNPSVFDFTSALPYGGQAKTLATGVYGLYVGDFNLSNTVNAVDFSTAGYLSESGTAGYKQGDFNFSGTVNASDGPFCLSNSGIASQVP